MLSRGIVRFRRFPRFTILDFRQSECGTHEIQTRIDATGRQDCIQILDSFSKSMSNVGRSAAWILYWLKSNDLRQVPHSVGIVYSYPSIFEGKFRSEDVDGPTFCTVGTTRRCSDNPRNRAGSSESAYSGPYDYPDRI